jgi:hypothetical protein
VSSIVIPKAASPSRMASDAAKSLRSRAAARSANANLMVPSRAADRSEPPDVAKAASNGSQPQNL